MGNSALVNYTKISPNKNTPRKSAIDTITIHCMAGQLSVETCGNVFAPASRQASSNYGIGPDGRVGLYVEEKDRSWCSSNAANDNRAITIEVASDSKPPYAVTPQAYAKLIELVADICRRNGIKALVWNNNKNSRIKHLAGANMTVHRDFAAKACPGERCRRLQKRSTLSWVHPLRLLLRLLRRLLQAAIIIPGTREQPTRASCQDLPEWASVIPHSIIERRSRRQTVYLIIPGRRRRI